MRHEYEMRENARAYEELGLKFLKVCYVCEKDIVEQDHWYKIKTGSGRKDYKLIKQRIGALHIYGGIWRHVRKCRTGMPTWKKSEVGKRSEVRQYYENGNNNNL